MMKTATRMILSSLLCLVLSLNLTAQTAPSLYYTFDASNPLSPTLGTGNLTVAGTYSTPSGGQVGKSLLLTHNVTGNVSGGSVSATNAITIQFIMKHGYKFDFSRDPQVFSWGNVIIDWFYPQMRFATSTNTGSGTVSHNLKVSLEGVNTRSWTYYKDNDWHMYTYVFDPVNGRKAIYVDGLLASGFEVTGLNTGTINGTTNNIRLNAAGVSYQKLDASMDEIAVYPVALTAAQIYKNFQEISAGQHYTTSLASSVPLALPTTASMDVNEFPVGYVANSASASSVTMTALTQMKNVPLPRYKPGHTALRHKNWMQLNYYGGYKQLTDVQARDTSYELNRQMATKWNYMILISDHVLSNKGNYTNPNHWSYRWIQLANANPTIPASVITFWAQLKPRNCNVPRDTSYISSKGLTAGYYQRNASGQFLTLGGTTTTAGSSKVISPACPPDSLRRDGETINCALQYLQTLLTRPINLISENNEILPIWKETTLALDPTVVAAKGALSWDEYVPTGKSRLSHIYRDQFTPGVQAVAASAGQSFVYSEYAVYCYDGLDNTDDKLRWKGERLTQDLTNGRILSTFDYYPRRPGVWWGQPGAFKGWFATIENINGTIASQDSFMAPFVNAGWSTNPESDMRASQYLGNMKLLCALGAIRLQPAYFNLDISNIANPKGYAYQTMMPSYAQGAFTNYPDWENSILLGGDWVFKPEKIGTLTGFQYYSGDRHKVIVVRQSRSNSNEYLITSCLQRLTNMAGENASGQTAAITLASTTVTIPVREQGSVMKWNKTDSTLVWYDQWHGAGDPTRWDGDFYIQAEVPDAGTPPLKTYGNVAYDYSGNITTAVSYADTATVFDTLKYTFQPRATKAYYVWVRARSKDGTSGNVILRLNGLTEDTTKAITETNWFYYRYKLTSSDTIKYTVTGDIDNIIKFRVTNKKIEVDQIVLTTSAALTFPESTVICGLTANVTAGGPTTFCAGLNVVLTATASSTYLWSTGSTAQSITVTTTGSYSVTIYDGAGCSGTSSATVVTVNAAPSIPTITVTAGTVCYGDTLTLQSSASTSYLWSTGVTTQSINVMTDALYQVIISDANGCTATNDYTADFNPPVTANTQALTSITGCSGDTVSLRLYNSYTYSSFGWFSYPDTATVTSTDSIFTFTISGTDTVKVLVEDADGCYGVSPAYVIKLDQCDTCSSVKTLRSSEITKSRAKIAWAKITNANYFEIYLTDRTTGKIITSTVEGARRSSIITGLKPNTPYTYYVISYCLDGSTYTSVTKKFTTLRY